MQKMQQMNLNLKEFSDRVLGCWLGKAVGGTLGAPFEKKRQINDVHFYEQELNGEAAPNDDLDLQLIWLAAVELHGLYQLTPRLIGEFWLSNIPCPAGEYAVCRANLANGLFPPLSGACHNEALMYSNGAWIRSEIWACLFPGKPDEAIKFAYLDACADHCGEGIFAEMFTASLESAAFIEHDLRKLLEIGLSKIPSDCRVARGVRTVIACHESGKDWLAAREAVLKECLPGLGWFQAPGNLAFMTLGLLYGEGDLGKTVCIAVNCGDDTDCTAGTAGAILGIIQGAAALPQEWLKPIGRKIVTCAIEPSDHAPIPKDLDELTERIVRRAQIATLENRNLLRLTEAPTEIPNGYADSLKGSETAQTIWERYPYELVFPLDFLELAIAYQDGPDFLPGQTKDLTIKVRFYTDHVDTLQFRWVTPPRWSINPACGSLMIRSWYENALSCSLTAADFRQYCEYLKLEIRAGDRFYPVTLHVPVTLAGASAYPNIQTDYPPYLERRRRIIHR